MRIKTNIRAGASPRCGGTMPPSYVPPSDPSDDGDGRFFERQPIL